MNDMSTVAFCQFYLLFFSFRAQFMVQCLKPPLSLLGYYASSFSYPSYGLHKQLFPRPSKCLLTDAGRTDPFVNFELLPLPKILELSPQTAAF